MHTQKHQQNQIRRKKVLCYYHVDPLADIWEIYFDEEVLHSYLPAGTSSPPGTQMSSTSYHHLWHIHRLSSQLLSWYLFQNIGNCYSCEGRISWSLHDLLSHSLALRQTVNTHPLHFVPSKPSKPSRREKADPPGQLSLKTSQGNQTTSLALL